MVSAMKEVKNKVGKRMLAARSVGTARCAARLTREEDQKEDGEADPDGCDTKDEQGRADEEAAARQRTSCPSRCSLHKAADGDEAEDCEDAQVCLG